MTDIEQIKRDDTDPNAPIEEMLRNEGWNAAIDYLHSRGYLGGVWQPIDTVPSDVDILLYCPEVHVTNPERVEVGCYRNTKAGSMHSWATHWMPLPEAPK